MCTSGLVNRKESSLLAEIYPKNVIGIEENNAVLTSGSRQVYEAPRHSTMVEPELFQLGSFLD